MKLEDAFKSLSLKFSSGNNIPVERATILREEWDAIRSIVEKFAVKKEGSIVLPHTIKIY
jgi:hypothetical protein